MSVVKKSDRIKHLNSPVCIAYEYAHKDKNISIAFIELRGRYPDKGRVTNQICKEMVFVVKGEGKVEIDGNEFILNEGDTILIQPNQKFFWEGNLVLVMPCHPAWYPEQHVEVE